MQPTTMTDIEKMEKKAPEATFVADTTPNEADEVTADKLTTAPQEQLDQLHSETPKQPTGNQ
ncbi:hypothetical protein CYJ96_06275 [Moraxella osloensis]|uniref:Uncharacterized protein n=1 Tax=Faucicola osloensis TaxID=34062 RepID=A0A2I1RI06_FAUOS|nr:hypothetical protein [Moraxella osloensis]PKZ68767.1 hypothetical protein CYJ96_06275 [Moraxella osloensis]